MAMTTGTPSIAVAALAELESLSREKLVALAKGTGLEDALGVRKTDLIQRVLLAKAEELGQKLASGLLEIIGDGYGFLRHNGVRPSPGDVYVSPSQIRRFMLRTGDLVVGQVRPPKDGEKYFGLLRVEAVNGMEPEEAKRRPVFEQMTPVFPDQMITLETTPKNLSNRLIDLLAPIGRGQRGLIVSPPKAGKTMLLKSIAEGISINAPDIHLMVALVGERPEEVTDMQRSVKGEVFSSTFDEPVEDHTRVAELLLERAKRLAEIGKDVVVLLDSLTRLTRAYNLAVPTSGRTLSGGIDPVALYPPKRFFGAARNIEHGGSLTVIATCLVDTGSRMDDVIYEEFKGTGNMELHLERKLAEKRIYPSIEIQRSGTRKEELLFDATMLRQVYLLRRIVAMIGSDTNNPTEATERVLERLSKVPTNAAFLASLSKGDV
jgi:transcription termination factor Rho